MNRKFYIFILLVIILVGCDDRKIVYSGFNDLVIGSQSFILYDDNTFYIELSAGGTEGNYVLKNDTISLKYFEKPNERWPDTMLMRENYFISIDSLDSKSSFKVKRDK